MQKFHVEFVPHSVVRKTLNTMGVILKKENTVQYWIKKVLSKSILTNTHKSKVLRRLQYDDKNLKQNTEQRKEKNTIYIFITCT